MYSRVLRPGYEMKGRREERGFPVIKDDYGNIVNPYIPRFIVKTPWYVKDTGPGDSKRADNQQSPLEHQRTHAESGPKAEIRDAEKVIVAGPKCYKQGACANCGALGHETGQCVERPLARGAKWTGRVIAETEVLLVDQERETGDFDAKRDRWRGYDPEQYDEVLNSCQATVSGHATPSTDTDTDSDSDSDTVKTSKQLRIREDTAKYLKDLSSNVAYDPKTRSMRDFSSNALAFVPSDPRAAREQVFAWQHQGGRNGLRGTKNTDSRNFASVEERSEEELGRLGVTKTSDCRYNY